MNLLLLIFQHSSAWVSVTGNKNFILLWLKVKPTCYLNWFFSEKSRVCMLKGVFFSILYRNQQFHFLCEPRKQPNLKTPEIHLIRNHTVNSRMLIIKLYIKAYDKTTCSSIAASPWSLCSALPLLTDQNPCLHWDVKMGFGMRVPHLRWLALE